ncbi:hypothetical protein [Mycolicibacterium fluoranthenivorans]|uniref:Uncharacterized protein n=1 Tax=Mycolicibacterium fluoranthenivorans TaxID=258505 RepID=A0A7X5U5U1_9MYCO|nr:hypothetical protein [Mycolicibacterium fluoranthenivorans]MCV7359164.1 hypothetical protein [Mycolicibacterium fluoranthenivorans]NIH98949.1 hypothetical protein [Mycolicibacterium fluoranthenivorans]
MSAGVFRPGWDIVVGVMCEALDNIASLFSKSDAQRRGDALIEAGYDLGTDPDDFLAPVLTHPTVEPFWGCLVHGRSGPCHDCLIEDEFPADEPPPLPPNCVAASQMFPQHTRTK